MKKTLFTFCILFIVVSLSAQLRPKPMAPTKATKGTLLEKPVKADIAMSKCERYMKYHKKMWKVILNSNPSSSNPLELSKEIGRLRFLPGNNSSGNIVYDKTSGAVPFPAITLFIQFSPNVKFPVAVTGSSTLYTSLDGSSSSAGMYWETGVYGSIKSVDDIYKIGTQKYIDITNTYGVTHTIKIFPEYLLDGCNIPTK